MGLVGALAGWLGGCLVLAGALAGWLGDALVLAGWLGGDLVLAGTLVGWLGDGAFWVSFLDVEAVGQLPSWSLMALVLRWGLPLWWLQSAVVQPALSGDAPDI